MKPFTLKRGDRGRPLVVTLTPDVNILGATVVLNMRQRDTGAMAITRGAMTILQASPGRVQYDWQAGQDWQAWLLSNPEDGVYEFEVEVTFANGQPVTYPSDGYWPLIIDPDLG
jgi:hypothetical protein